MKKEEKNKNLHTKTLALCAIYSVIMIFVLVFSIFILSKKGSTPTEVTKYVVETQYVYVSDKTTEPDTTPESIPVAESVFETLIVKEYQGKIGIFNLDDELVYCIDVYTKTLPEADRRLLEEGFEITDEKQLYSIIQDYSS